MKKFNRLSVQSARIIFLTVTLYVLLVSIAIFLQTMVFNSLTSDYCLWGPSYKDKVAETGFYIREVFDSDDGYSSDLKAGDNVVAINNTPVDNLIKAQNILNQSKDGEVLFYTVFRNGEQLNIPVKISKYLNVQTIGFSLMGFFFLLVGSIVAYSKPNEYLNRLFFILCCSACLSFLIIGNLNAIFELNSFLLANSIIAQLIFFPVFLHFFLTFPVKFFSRWRKIFIPGIYLLIIIGATLQLVFSGIAAINLTIFILAMLYLFSGVVLFIYSYTSVKEPERKKPLRIILFGLIIGGLGFVYVITISAILNRPVFLTNSLYYIPSILMIAIPLSFGFAIFRYKIMDSEFIVKRSLVFGIVTALVIGIYLLSVFVLDLLVSQYFFENKTLITIIVIIIITFSFEPVNTRLRDFVDRQLYRERYNYRKALLEFSENLPYMSDLNDIVLKVGSSVNETMGIKKLNVWINSHNPDKLVNKGFRSSSTVEFKQTDQSIDNAFLELFKYHKEPVLLYGINLSELNISDKFKEIFIRDKIVLSVPIFSKDKLLGSLNFGEKPSGKVYSEEDVDLLKTLAFQCSIAIENARLQVDEIDKRKIEHEINIAARIQNELLPTKLDHNGQIEIDALNLPAESIASDYYDMLKMKDNKILLLVADVSGKGIPAAIYMSKIQAMIKFAANIFDNPKDILCEVNRLMHKKTDSSFFITILMCLIDLDNKTLKVCRAGHPHLLFTQNGETKILKDKSVGIGLIAPDVFENSVTEHEIVCDNGDLFFFYSDGLTDQVNESGEMFGIERLMKFISNNHELNPGEVNGHLINDIIEFRGNTEQKDDITILNLKIK